jgi:chemotaxis protein CheY-P-specific phosphatase CheC
MPKVTNSIFEVLETMFYFTVEEKKRTAPDVTALIDLKNPRACKITFSGKQSGAMYLLLPQDVLDAMTRNFLGENEEHLPEEMTDGTLKEALNMIAGSALTQFDEESYMGLGIPEMVDPGTITFDDDAVVFNSEQGVIVSCVDIDKTASHGSGG